MLLLVQAYRHHVRLVGQDIRRHQAGIGEQANVNVIGVLLGFILKLGHSGKLPELGVAVQQPGQLRVSMNVALDKEQAFVQVDAAGQQQGVSFQGVFTELGRVLPHRDSMQIRQGENTVIVILKAYPVSQGAYIIAQGDSAAGLDRAENYFFTLRSVRCFHGKGLLILIRLQAVRES